MNASDDSDSTTPKTTKSARFFSKITSAVKNLFTIKPSNKDQFQDVLRHVTEKSVISHESYNMIQGVLQVSDMQVRDIMVPRSQMIVLEKDSKLEEFIPQMIESGHSRFPVIGTNRDEVLGTLLAKDLLPFIVKRDPDITLKDILRPAMVIPESKRLNILLKEFRVKKQHMAIIADEYGGISGLVTIEDVLEQIVGDIEDEFDTEENTYIIEHKDNVFHVQALTPIEDFNKYFGSNFSDDEFDTIGGLVLNAIGHLPKKNETTTINGFHVKVLSADKRRIRLLQITKPMTDSNDEDDDQSTD